MNSLVRTAGLVSAGAPSPISDIHKHLLRNVMWHPCS